MTIFQFVGVCLVATGLFVGGLGVRMAIKGRDRYIATWVILCGAGVALNVMGLAKLAGWL